ncbi:MAG: BatD family protein [Planctomycetota bacterium]
MTILAFASIALSSASAPGQVRVVAQVDTSRDIYVGQNFNYMIIIDGATKAGQVDLSPLAQYNPKGVGTRRYSDMTSRVFVMNYSLTANRPGQVVLPPVTVTFDGKKYTTKPVQVNILKPGTTDKLDFAVELSDEKCYVGQPVIITVKFYVAADVGNFQFNIPALTDDSFYIEEPEVSDPQAKLFRLHTGMTVAVSQNQVTHKGRGFNLVSFSKVLIPKKPGELDLGTPSLTAAVAVGRTRSRGPFDDFGFFGSRKEYKQFEVTAKPMKLSVLPLPNEGKPPGFYGLVGRYTIESSATPTDVSIGEPITLTIKIGGSRYLKPVKWPELEQVPELAENFKIPSQKASPIVQGGSKVFTQTIRANNDKVAAVPPIPLPYFDADKGQYVVAGTKPIPLKVAPTKVLTNADLQGTGLQPVNKRVEAIKKGLSANYEGPDVLLNQTFSPLSAIVSPGYLVMWSLPLAGLIITVFAKVATSADPEKIAKKTRRQAKTRALKQLKQIAASNADRRQEMLAAAMKQYIGERFHKIAGSLTADECHNIILAESKDEQDAANYRDIIAECETSRYAAAEVNVDSARITRVADLIRRVDLNTRK